MKRPKLPQLRIPKKYRDGKLFGAVISAIDEKFEQAKGIEDTRARFIALGRVEKIAEKQYVYLWRKVHGVRSRREGATLAGYGTLSVGACVGGLIFGAPVLVPVGLGVFMFGLSGHIIAGNVTDTMNKKKALHPLSVIEHLYNQRISVTAEMKKIALADPALLVEVPRFKTLCGENPAISVALTEAFARAQAEKPATALPAAPDLTRALAKPRLASPDPKAKQP